MFKKPVASATAAAAEARLGTTGLSRRSLMKLAALGGGKVYMFQEDCGKWKKIKNKPSKMKTFSISNDPNRPTSKLEVREDRRNESGGIAAPPFAGKKLAGAAAAGSTVDTGDGGGDDDIPF